MSKFKKFIKEWYPVVLIICFTLFSKTYIAEASHIQGSSMEPTLSDNDFVMLNKFDKQYDYNDLIIFKNIDSNRNLVKRIVGLPGDKIYIQNHTLYVNDIPKDEAYIKEEMGYDFPTVIVPPNHYFVCGDNRNNSLDSRQIGFINYNNIRGKIEFRFFPFDKITDFD